MPKAGPFRPGRGDSAWTPGGEAFRLRLARPARVASRLALPVVLLVTLLGSAFLYSDDLLILPGLPAVVQKALLATSDLILPVAWYTLHLTTRRYGAPYAFGQLVAALAVLALAMLLDPAGLDNWIATTPALSSRAMIAFLASFLFANFIAIVFFDAARGPRWWTAPLAASFAASLVFSAVYYPAAFAGGEEVAWTDSAWVHFCLFFGESVLLLVPYWLMRPATRPMYGMNGY